MCEQDEPGKHFSMSEIRSNSVIIAEKYLASKGLEPRSYVVASHIPAGSDYDYLEKMAAETARRAGIDLHVVEGVSADGKPIDSYRRLLVPIGESQRFRTLLDTTYDDFFRRGQDRPRVEKIQL